MNSPTRPCPQCGDTLPAQARFCGSCGQVLPPPEEEEQKKRGGLVIMPSAPAIPTAAQTSAVPPAALRAAAQTGSPAIPGVPAGPQSASPTVPNAPAGPQGPGTSVPTAPAGPQGPGATVPTAPGGAQTGSVFHGVTRTAGHGLRSKLLGTVPAKILAAALAVAVVAGGTVAVLAATGTKPPTPGSGGPAQSSGSQPTNTTPSSTANTSGPNGAPPNNASFKLTIEFPTADSTSFLPGNPEKQLLITAGSGSAESTVCGPHDDGQPFIYPDPTSGITYTTTTTCSGTYHDGMLTYTLTFLQFDYSQPGQTCTTAIPSPWTVTFHGTFTSPTTISGTATEIHGEQSTNCTLGPPETVPPLNDTYPWTGTLTTTP